MRSVYRHLGAVAMAAMAPAACAPLGPAPAAIWRMQDERVLLAVLQNQVEAVGPGVCLATPIQGAPPDYRTTLTTKPSILPLDRQQGYREDAQMLVGVSDMPPPGPVHITLPILRENFPDARFVAGEQCTGLIIAVRPIIVENRAFLAFGRSHACGAFFYRVSLVRADDGWIVRHVDQLGVHGGPPGCASSAWNAPSGVPIERIRLSNP